MEQDTNKRKINQKEEYKQYKEENKLDSFYH